MDYKVKICGVPHKVLHKDDCFNAGERHFGQIDYKKCEILLSTGMNEEMEKQTLFHEMMHGILFGVGYSELAENEQFVQALAQAMTGCFEVIKDVI